VDFRFAVSGIDAVQAAAGAVFEKIEPSDFEKVKRSPVTCAAVTPLGRLTDGVVVNAVGVPLVHVVDPSTWASISS